MVLNSTQPKRRCGDASSYRPTLSTNESKMIWYLALCKRSGLLSTMMYRHQNIGCHVDHNGIELNSVGEDVLKRGA